MKVANISFGNLSHLKYLGIAVRNQNLVQEEIKRKLNSGDACYTIQCRTCGSVWERNLVSDIKQRT
jgi:translation initiation factor 2 beta subunit (eIF-2beta)/eIF-5